MPQFLLSKPAREGETASLPDEEAHHVRDVVRHKVGETIFLCDPEGAQYAGEITSLTKDSVTVKIRTKKPPKENSSRVALAQALVKGDKMEFIIQKAVELGADDFHPFWSSRTIVKWKDKEDKLARWQKIADAAMKQCGRPTRMTVHTPQEIRAVLKTEASSKILFWEESQEPIKPYLKKVQAGSYLVLVGSEGGLSADEVNEARKNDFKIFSFGQRILRTETAAVVALTLLQYELDNL